MPNTISQSGLLRILLCSLDCLREIEDGCLEPWIRRTEGERGSPAASAHVKQLLTTSQINALRHQTRWAE